MNRNISGKVKAFVFERDKGKCVYCGSTENLEFDHIIPATKGGSNSENNIQLVCMKCNCVKFNYIDDDNILEKKNKPKKKRTNNQSIRIEIYRELVHALDWESGDDTSALYEIYNKKLGISLKKNRRIGLFTKYLIDKSGLGIIYLPFEVLNLIFYSDNKEVIDDFELGIMKTIDGQTGLFLFKKEDEK